MKCFPFPPLFAAADRVPICSPISVNSNRQRPVVYVVFTVL